MNRKEHWTNVYAAKRSGELSWFQADPATSVRLLERAGFTQHT